MAAARRGTSSMVPVRPACRPINSSERAGRRARQNGRALLTKPSLVLADRRW